MKVAKPMQIEMPVLTKLKALQTKEISLICPTLMVDGICQSYPLLFEHMFTGMTPLSFWEQVSPNDPKLLSLLPNLEQIDRWQDKAIPVAIHGDGAVFTNRDSNTLLTVSVRSLLNEGFADSIIPLFSIPKAIRGAGDNDCVKMLWHFDAHFPIMHSVANTQIETPMDRIGQLAL